MLALAIGSAVLAGCNPSDGSDSENTSQSGSDSFSTTADLMGATGSSTVSGRVADGYLVGATVCIDLNNNDRCDVGEPSGETETGGQYTITGATEAQVENGRILVMVDENTIDEDTGDPVEGRYTLTSPEGENAFVSPLSTMLQTTIENNPGLSPQSIRREFATNIGLSPQEAAGYLRTTLLKVRGVPILIVPKPGIASHRSQHVL